MTVRVREPVLEPGSRAAGRWAVDGHVDVEATLKLHTSPVMALAVAPDGRMAMSGSGGQYIKVFELSAS